MLQVPPSTLGHHWLLGNEPIISSKLPIKLTKTLKSGVIFSQKLLRFYLLASVSKELALLESRDQGKTVAAARMIDIPRAATNFRYFAEAIMSPKLDRV